jgi:hypothetical protein
MAASVTPWFIVSLGVNFDVGIDCEFDIILSLPLNCEMYLKNGASGYKVTV